MLDNPTALTPETPLPAMALLQAESPTPENPKSLKACVHSALTRYFENMDNKTSKNIYQMVMAQVEPPLIKSTLDLYGLAPIVKVDPEKN